MVLLSKEWTQEYWNVLNYILVLLLLFIVGAGVVVLNQRVRRRNFREFAKTAGCTLQLKTCGGIGPGSLHEYLLALAMALRTQAMLRNLKLHPGEFEQVVTDAIESAYLLKRENPNKDVARGALLLFAVCLDPIMSKALSGEATLGDAENFVGTAGGVTMLASAGWHAKSNADLVTCALTEASLAEGVAEYWRTMDQAHRDQVESSFERVVSTALDPATAAYVRHKAFSDLRNADQSGLSKPEWPEKSTETQSAT